MSLQAIVILSGISGGATWTAITLAATWWFKRRARQQGALSQREVDAILAKLLGR